MCKRVQHEDRSAAVSGCFVATLTKPGYLEMTNTRTVNLFSFGDIDLFRG